MTPNVPCPPTGVLYEGETLLRTEEQESSNEKEKYRIHVVWRNVIIFSVLHLASIYGIYLVFTSAKIVTTLFAVLLYQLSALGITAGAHRLWAHRSYKAKWPLRLILMFMNTLAFQDSAIHWARDHRLHHRHSETDADPHNAKRGFFFSHVGWLLCRKHEQVKLKGEQIDLSDLWSDPILRFQKKYYAILMPLFCFYLPTVMPVYLWGETWTNALLVPTVLRYVFTLNITWLVNSAAHMFGNKSYDKDISPVENKSVAVLALGEGWHNYHHVFPWDYKTSELGNYRMNTTKAFIDFFAKIGWAYDLKTVKEDVVKSRVERTGDGSHARWGWGDKDQTQEEKEATIVINRKSQ